MKYFSLFLLLLASHSFLAQVNDSTLKTPNKYVLKLALHSITSANLRFTANDWSTFKNTIPIPDSMNEYMPKDFSLSTSSGLDFSFSMIHNYNHPTQKFRYATTFQLGFGPRLTSNKKWNYTTSKIIDTLVSSQNGGEIYVYENRNASIVNTYNARTFFVGIGEHFLTNPNRIFQFETGLDLQFYFTYQSSIKSTYTDVASIDPTYSSLGYTLSSTNPSMEQRSKGSLKAGMILRLPLSFSFKLSKTKNHLKDMRIGFEFNPGVVLPFSKSSSIPSGNFSSALTFRYAL